MKKLYALLFLIACSFGAWSQWSQKGFAFDGKQRQYLMFLPSGYDPSVPAPLVVILHGLGGSMNDAVTIGFDSIADAENIVLLSAQALDFNSPLGLVESVWNAGLVLDIPGLGNVKVNDGVDDVGFLNAMLDSTLSQVAIDRDRVYLSGASLGGFMAQRLACESSSRFAALASVMGTYALALPPCAPAKELPMAHFHGTNDDVVTYDGHLTIGNSSFLAGLSVDALVEKWVDIDQCDLLPLHDIWPDNNNDGLYVEHFSYTRGGESYVELFKVNGGGHEWYSNENTDGDVDYVSEIWNFFNRFRRGATFIAGPSDMRAGWSIYPNPCTDELFIKGNSLESHYKIMDLMGRTVLSGHGNTIVVSDLPMGPYILLVGSENGTFAQRFVKM